MYLGRIAVNLKEWLMRIYRGTGQTLELLTELTNVLNTIVTGYEILQGSDYFFKLFILPLTYRRCERQ